MKIISNEYFLRLKFFLLPLILVSLIISKSSAQKMRFATTADAEIDSSNRRIASKSCNLTASYIPDTLHPEFAPMRYVRINIHVMQDGNGKNNFSGAEGRKWVKGIVESANQ